jgi:hypothetical protein
MNVLDFPFLIEILFVVSLLVFLVTLYVVLPAFIHEKRTFFKPTLVNSLWVKSYNKIKGELKNGLNNPQKKNLRQIPLIISKWDETQITKIK